MTLKFTGGEAKGRDIKSLRGRDTRPTAALGREAMFNILRERVPDSRWLDLFAGNGTIGLEALSRGAEFVTFAESNRDAARMITTNLQTFGYEDRAFVWCGDVLRLLARYQAEPFDVAFLDPPWEKVDYKQIMRKLLERGLVKPDGMIVAEHSKRYAMPEEMMGWQLVRQAAYGDSTFSFYALAAAETEPEGG